MLYESRETLIGQLFPNRRQKSREVRREKSNISTWSDSVYRTPKKHRSELQPSECGLFIKRAASSFHFPFKIQVTLSSSTFIQELVLSTFKAELRVLSWAVKCAFYYRKMFKSIVGSTWLKQTFSFQLLLLHDANLWVIFEYIMNSTWSCTINHW